LVKSLQDTTTLSNGENASIFDFELTSVEMETINGLNKDERIGSNPDKFDF
jgi:diketogulonate reductase-like aldo/keto reductase